MKILWINHFVPFPAKGGLLIRTNNLIEGVAKHHDVHLVSLVQPRLLSPYYESVDKGMDIAQQHLDSFLKSQRYFTMPSEKSRFHRLKTAFFALFSKRPYSVNWLTSIEMKAFITKLLKEQEFDAIHVDTMGLCQYLPKELNTRVIVNHHNAEHAMMHRRSQNETNALKKFYFGLESKKIANYDLSYMQSLKEHICCSDDDRQLLLSLEPSLMVNVVPNGVRYKSKPAREPVAGKLLFVGGLDWYPNEDAICFLLREIWPTLSQKFPSLSLDIVGKNPSREIVELVSQFSNVTLHGYVESLEQLYKEAMAFICPIRDGGGTKLKVLDAMNQGLPVIGTDVTFEGINIENGVNAMVAHSLCEYVKHIEALLSSSEYVLNIGKKANSLIDTYYDSNKIAENYVRYLSNQSDV